MYILHTLNSDKSLFRKYHNTSDMQPLLSSNAYAGICPESMINIVLTRGGAYLFTSAKVSEKYQGDKVHC